MTTFEEVSVKGGGEKVRMAGRVRKAQKKALSAACVRLAGGVVKCPSC